VDQRLHRSRTLDEIRVRGFEVLVESLGPADAIRFIRSYSHGSGDYAGERKAWLEQGLDTVVAGVLERRKREGGASHTAVVGMHQTHGLSRFWRLHPLPAWPSGQ
jgi:hypothetical protein